MISEGELQKSLNVIKQCLIDLDTVRRQSYLHFDFLGVLMRCCRQLESIPGDTAGHHNRVSQDT